MLWLLYIIQISRNCLMSLSYLHHSSPSYIWGRKTYVVSCDIHIVILSSSDQWHLVETNCNNIFTTRNSWNISRSSKRHSFPTTFPCFSCCLWDHGWLGSPGLFTSLLRFFQTDSEVTHYRRRGLHLASHDIMSSRHMTCHHHLPAPSSQSRFNMTNTDPGRVNIWTSWKVSCLQENFYVNILLILFHAVMLDIYMAVGPLLSVICARGWVIDPVLFVWMSNKFYEP